MNKKREVVVKAGVVIGIVLMAIVSVFAFSIQTINQLDSNVEEPSVENGEWHIVAKTSSLSILGEHDPGGSGWLSFFCLDYGETPGVVLANNATDWSSDATAMGYIDYDGEGHAPTDLVSEDPFYFVSRCRFDDSVKDGDDFMDNRCKCTLNVTGDETINEVEGTGVVSYNDSGHPFLYINFYWDDGDDGYQISDDGSLDWDLVIYAKY